MSTVFHFVRTFPSLTISIIVAIVGVPLVIQLISFVLRLQAALEVY